MQYTLRTVFISIILFFSVCMGQGSFPEDVIATDDGDLKITFIGHGTLMFTYNDMVIHVDPVSRVADYANMPKADIILVTHQHGDHMDAETIDLLKTDDTAIVLTETCAESLTDGIIIALANGQETIISDITVEAVPAYNLVHMRSAGRPYHPKGEGNGYVITLGGKRVYVAGDTENVPEMKALEDIDVAFLPMNLPYTMTPEMVADAAMAFNPKILYPYHTGETDLAKLEELLAGQDQIDLRLRDMK